MILLLFSSGVTDHVRTVDDALALVDSRAQVSNHVRTITDNLGITEAVGTTSSSLHTQSLSESLGLADDVVGQRLGSYDLLGLTDSVSYIKFGVAHARSITDGLGITDTGHEAIHDVEEVLTEALGLDDASAQVFVANRTISDVLGLADALAGLGTPSRTFTDTVGITDSRVQVRGINRTITDALGASDSTFRSASAFGPTLLDPLGLTDLASVVQVHNRTITDALGAVDSRVFFRARTITDQLGMRDPRRQSRVQGLVHARTLTDALGLDDSTGYAEDESPWTVIDPVDGGVWGGPAPVGGVWTVTNPSPASWS